VHRNFRKPLIALTPKSLLRHKLAVSRVADMTEGSRFRFVIPEIDEIVPPERVRRVVLCSGKVYYDLLAARREQKINDVAILRLEQIYPFPGLALIDELSRFPKAEIIWCQEEPKNQGAWSFVAPSIESVMHELGRKDPLRYTGRKASASPAAGQMSQHLAELAAYLNDALTL
jgi:2-oxoglutarate dehydrogenase E1 component